MVDDGKTPTVPYVSFRTFFNLLERLHSGGIPQHIDRHYWGGFLAGSTGQQVMAALRFFGLITPNDEPTPALERLADPAQRKTTLNELLRERYGAIWESGVDPARTTPGHLDSTFKTLYKVEGETRRKAVTFFVHAAKFAEMTLSSQISSKTRQRRAPSSSTSRTRPKGELPPPRTAATRDRPPVKDQLPSALDSGPYAILHALLDQLPSDGRWTSEIRKRWLAALQANVDFLVTVEDEPDNHDAYDFEDYEDEEGEELPD
jgi:hypothetical protein